MELIDSCKTTVPFPVLIDQNILLGKEIHVVRYGQKRRE